MGEREGRGEQEDEEEGGKGREDQHYTPTVRTIIAIPP